MPAATPMTENDWSRFVAVVRGASRHPDYWHHAPVLNRGLAEVTRLRSTPDRAEADDAALGAALRAAL